jgi:hypothetical protein
MRRLPFRVLAAVQAAVAAALLAACATGAPPASAGAATGDAALTGRYSGVLMDLGNVLPRTGAERLTVWLEDLTPREELAELADASQERLRNALAEREVGRVRFGQGTSHPIAVALAADGDEGLRHLVLVVARPLTLREIFGASLTADYPFSVIELDVDGRGEGSGELNVAARISFTDGGRVVIDELAIQPVRILGVERGD